MLLENIQMYSFYKWFNNWFRSSNQEIIWPRERIVFSKPIGDCELWDKLYTFWENTGCHWLGNLNLDIIDVKALQLYYKAPKLKIFINKNIQDINIILNNTKK